MQCGTHTHTHTFNSPLSRTTQVSRYQKGKTSLDFTEARDNEWHWHQLGHMQVCILLQIDNHASTHHTVFFTDRMPFLPPNQQHQSTEPVKENVPMVINLQTTCIWVDISVTNVSKSFTDKMAAKTGWHRYGMNLCHCHPIYCLQWLNTVVWMPGRASGLWNWVIYWHGYLSGARCILFAYDLANVTAILTLLSSLASLKYRIVLPFWCWLNLGVLEKRPLKRCLFWPSVNVFYVCFFTSSEWHSTGRCPVHSWHCLWWAAERWHSTIHLRRSRFL